MKKDLHEMTAEIVATFKRYDTTGTSSWTYETAGKDLMCQVGSLMKLLMQLKGERYAHGKTPEELKEAIKDEVADIMADTLFLAHELNIDPYEAWQKMADSDTNKINTRSKDK